MRPLLCTALLTLLAMKASAAQKSSEMRILLGTMTFGGQTAASDALAQLELFQSLVLPLYMTS